MLPVVSRLSLFALLLALASCTREPTPIATPPGPPAPHGATEPPAPAPHGATEPPAPAPHGATEPPAPAPHGATEPPAPALPSELASRAPDEPRDGDLVEVTALIPSAVLDLRYATEHNFTKRQLYPVPRCLLRRAVAARLAKVAARLAEHDRRLLLWDCYRPSSIQQALWELVPDPRYVAKPSFAADGTPLGGSRHSRGAAVDLALADSGGHPLPMPTDHDDFSAAAQPRRAHRAPRGGADARLLAEAMIAEGFSPIASEWWHFDAPDAARYPFSNQPLTCAPCTEPR